MQTTTSNLLAKVTSCPVLEDSSILLTNGIGNLIKRADGNQEKLAYLSADLIGNPNAWAAGMLANTPQAQHLQKAEDLAETTQAAAAPAPEAAQPTPRRTNSRKAAAAPEPVPAAINAATTKGRARRSAAA